MIEKFGILNPNTGAYVYVESIEEARVAMAQIAAAFFLAHTHGTPCSRILVDENGAETWSGMTLSEVIGVNELEQGVAGTFTDIASNP